MWQEHCNKCLFSFVLKMLHFLNIFLGFTQPYSSFRFISQQWNREIWLKNIDFMLKIHSCKSKYVSTIFELLILIIQKNLDIIYTWIKLEIGKLIFWKVHQLILALLHVCCCPKVVTIQMRQSLKEEMVPFVNLTCFCEQNIRHLRRLLVRPRPCHVCM